MRSKANMKIKLCIFQFIYHTKHWCENFQLLGMKQTECFKEFLKYSAFLCQKLGSYLCIFITFLITRVADPDPDPVFFAWIRIWIRFSNISESGSRSGFQIFWIRIWIRFQPRFWKIAERSLKVIYQKKT